MPISVFMILIFYKTTTLYFTHLYLFFFLEKFIDYKKQSNTKSKI